MVGCGLACPGGGVQGCRGASSGGRGGGGTVGARIRGLGVSGQGGGGVLGDPYPLGGGGGGVATRNTGPYIYIYIYICKCLLTFYMYIHIAKPTQTRDLLEHDTPIPVPQVPGHWACGGSSAG